jgi:HEAT repeat protein
LLIALRVPAAAHAQPTASPAPSKTSALIQQLQDPNPDRRKEAAIALMAMKPVPAEAQTAMLRAVGLPNNEIRKAIADAGGLPITDLTAALHGRDENAQIGALWVLGDMAPCAALRPINSPMPRTPMRE